MNRQLGWGIALVALLAGCAGPQYWHEPPATDMTGQAGLYGTWQGLVRHRYAQTFHFLPLHGAVSVRCATYADKIRFDVDGPHLRAQLGAEPVITFDTPLAADGRFYHRMGVEGDTWIWGGVAVFNEEPTLSLSGQLDPVTGLGRGEVAVGPGRDGLGCYGEFRVSREGGPPAPDALGDPFRIQYWIDDANRDRDHHILGNGSLWPRQMYLRPW